MENVSRAPFGSGTEFPGGGVICVWAGSAVAAMHLCTCAPAPEKTLLMAFLDFLSRACESDNLQSKLTL